MSHLLERIAQELDSRTANDSTFAGKIVPGRPSHGGPSSHGAVIAHAYVMGHGVVQYHKTDSKTDQANEIRPEDGPEMGLPSAATMHRLLASGLHTAEFHGRGRHGGGFFKAIIDSNYKFYGWTRTASRDTREFLGPAQRT